MINQLSQSEIQQEADNLRGKLEIAEEKLKESEEKFLRLSDASFEAVLIIDNNRVQETNKNFTKIFGWSLADLQNSTTPQFIAPESLKDVMKHFSESHEESHEAVGLRKDGSTLDIEISCKHFNFRGKDLKVVVIRDISRRKKMQEDLKLRALFANLNPGPVLRCDHLGTIKMANKSAMEIFGIDDLNGLKLNTIIPDIEKTGIESCIKNDSIVSFSAPVGEKYYQFTLKGVSELGVVQIYGSEITSLKESENRIRAIISSVNDAIIMICGEGYTAVWNKAAERIFGYTAEEVLGKKVGDFIIPEKYIERHIAGVTKFKETGKGVNVGKTLELSALRKNGEEFPVEISYAPPVQIKGRWHATTVIRDITERKNAEEKIKEIMAEQKTILDSAGVGIVMVKNDKIVWFNKSFNEIMGCKKTESKSINLVKIFPSKEECEKITKMGHPKLAKGETVRFEGEMKLEDGSMVWLRRVVKAVDPSDLSKGKIAIIEDFTERKKMEEKLREAKEKAEEATKLKDKFVSLVAHDLKSPFNSILGFMKLVNDDKKNPLFPKHKEMIGRALESGNTLVNMIEELLKISRLQTGKLTVKKKFFDAYLSAAYAVGNLGYLAEQKGIRLTNNVTRGTRFYADVTLFGEVIQNLLSNAIKFCSKGDSITLFIPPESGATIAVKDTGVGINEKYLQKIFQHEETTSTRGTAGEKGTGLGMPFSHDIMEAHEGSLRVESKEGEGSAFYAELPVVRPQILLVDDDEATRFMFKESMAQYEMTIIEAANGEEALKLLEKTTPHLILTDVEMPFMDGFKLLKHIRNNSKTKFTPVIIITSSSSVEAREKAFQLGADDFVTKPLIIEELIPRVKRFVG